MITRLLAPADREAWLDFMRNVEPSFRPYKLPEDEFDRILVARDELHFVISPSPVAIACYGMLRGLQHASGIPMVGVATAAKYRCLGLARGMMNTLHSTARSLGFDRVGLHVDDDNDSAKLLYESLGYRQEGDKWLCSL